MIAALAMGRNAIGIEINETRIAHCKGRLNVTNLAKLVDKEDTPSTAEGIQEEGEDQQET